MITMRSSQLPNIFVWHLHPNITRLERCSLWSTHKLQWCSFLQIQCTRFLTSTKNAFIKADDVFRDNGLIMHPLMIMGNGIIVSPQDFSILHTDITKYRKLVSTFSFDSTGITSIKNSRKSIQPFSIYYKGTYGHYQR
jgi:hypothetical protein